MLRIIHLCFFTVIAGLLTAQTSYFVGPKGKDRADYGLTVKKPFATLDYATAQLVAGDTLNVLAGTYYNATYGDGDRWKNDRTLSVANLDGSPGAYTVIRAYPGDDVVLRGDGKYILQIRKCSYLRVEGFEVYGEVENIPLDTALAYQFAYREAGSTETIYRIPPGTPDAVVDTMTFPKLSNVSRPTYTDTKGLLVQKSHHIEVMGNHVHHLPGTGLRLQQCGYVDVIGNEVDNCSRRSFSGTHALVFDSSDDIDTLTGVKMRIEANYIHDNYNEIYSWAPTKTIVTPHIDEGKGISLQRNDADHGWTYGRFLVINNLTHGNGFSGLHSNYGRGIDFINNTSYHDSRSGGGRNHGISLSNSTDCRIINNIVASDASKGGFPIAIDTDSYGNVIDNNLVNNPVDRRSEGIATRTTVAEPKFVNPAQRDFRLTAASPAVGSALAAFAPPTDLNGEGRDAVEPDQGALEFVGISTVSRLRTPGTENSFAVELYPNPVNDVLWLELHKLPTDLIVYDAYGRVVLQQAADERADRTSLKVSGLPTGTYTLVVGGTEVKRFIVSR